MPPHQVILFIIGTLAILVAAYYVTYFIGTKASGQMRAGMRNRSIVLRDRYAIARDKCFCVVEVAGKIYIVGTTAASMTLLDTLDAREYDELTESSAGGPQMPWTDTPVGRYGNKLTKKVVAYVAKKTGRADSSPYHPPGADKAAGNSFSESMKQAERSASGRNAAENKQPEDD